MYLSEIKIRNYKSFYDSDSLTFAPGINLIIGTNNSGKSTLLEALSLTIKDKPHKSLGKENAGPYSKISFCVTIDRKDELDVFLENTITIPSPAYPSEDALSVFNERISNAELRTCANVSREGCLPASVHHDLYQKQKPGLNGSTMRIARAGDEHPYLLENEAGGGNYSETLGNQIVGKFISSIYHSYPERPKLGTCQATPTLNLHQDASNLAAVLHTLQSQNPNKFKRYVELVGRVIPDVKGVTVPLKDNNVVEIMIWSIENDTEREDLAIPLSDCGTGIGQVLAILYTVVASAQPQTIIIDEPQSFLHPGAAKRLIQILKKYNQHQYFISTHSPELVRIAEPATITSVHRLEGVSQASTLGIQETDKLQKVLNEIGVSVSDILFPENILWVEGQTEEKAFPLIIKKFGGDSLLLNTKVLPIKVGEIRSKKQSGKNAELAIEIYKQLSGAGAVISPALGIIIDKELSSPQEMTDLTKLAGDLLKFLPRRCYENYLLDYDAIAFVYNEVDSSRETPFPRTSLDVESWINDAVDKRLYLPKSSAASEDDWFAEVDGANLLGAMFSEFSNREVYYQKTDHSIRLTNWLLENKQDHLVPIWELLESVLKASDVIHN